LLWLVWESNPHQSGVCYSVTFFISKVAV